MKLRQITPEFVSEIPKGLDPEKLYVCCRYRAVKHLCACGCGAEINTPLHPTAWTLMCDGVSVSLTPSIGNWSEKCQSHYWITNNRVQWASKLSRRKILHTRRQREWDREQYFSANTNAATDRVESERLPVVTSMRGCFTRLWRWMLRRC